MRAWTDAHLGAGRGPRGPGSVRAADTAQAPSPSKLEKRSVFLDRGSGRYATSDEDDAFESPGTQRRAVSVDEFLRGSELGKQVSGQRLGLCVPPPHLTPHWPVHSPGL